MAACARRISRLGRRAEIGGEQLVGLVRRHAGVRRRRRRGRTSPSRSRHIRNRSARAACRRRGSWPAADRCGRRSIGSADLRLLQFVGERQIAGQGVRHAAVRRLRACAHSRGSTWNSQNMKPAPETCFGISSWKRRISCGDAADIGAHIVAPHRSSRRERRSPSRPARRIVHLRREAGRVGGARRHDLALARTRDGTDSPCRSARHAGRRRR